MTWTTAATTRPLGHQGRTINDEVWRNFAPDIFQSLPIDGGSESSHMTVASLSRHLHEFAVELRRLAYTMPAGHEDPLIQLSERMLRCAREQAAAQQQR